jgi:uncharacterized protein YndB with AHSA1/START domain
MADILHDLWIDAAPARVFEAVSTPAGLESWWTGRSSGEPGTDAEYTLWFSPEYDWRGRVSRHAPDSEFELEITRADSDWTGTRVGFVLLPRDGGTSVRFHHTGWAEPNEHFRISSYCWAMYLRLLKRYVEQGEVLPYEQREGN